MAGIRWLGQRLQVDLREGSKTGRRVTLLAEDCDRVNCTQCRHEGRCCHAHGDQVTANSGEGPGHRAGQGTRATPGAKPRLNRDRGRLTFVALTVLVLDKALG